MTLVFVLTDLRLGARNLLLVDEDVSPPVTLGPGHYDPNVSLTKEKKREAHIDPGNLSI